MNISDAVTSYRSLQRFNNEDSNFPYQGGKFEFATGQSAGEFMKWKVNLIDQQATVAG